MSELHSARQRQTFAIAPIGQLAATGHGIPNLLNIRGRLAATDRLTAAILVTATEAMRRSES